MGKNRNAYNNAWKVFSDRKEHYWSDITQSGFGCSSGTCWCLRYAGIITENESFHAAGNKEGVLADPTRFEKIKFSADKVQPMDILVKWGVHVATWAGDGYKSLYECAPERSHSVATNGTGCGLHRGHTLYNCGTGSVDWDYIYRIKEDDEKNVVDIYMEKADEIANDNSHGYDNHIGSNLGPDFGQPDMDCGGFVSTCLRYASLIGSSTIMEPNCPTGTWGYDTILTAAGFTKFTFNAATVKRGDVLIRDGHHTELAYGNGKSIGAHYNYDSKQGDSQNNEISIVNLASNWDYMYRYNTDPESAQETTVMAAETIGGFDMAILSVLTKGKTGAEVKSMQALLNGKNNAGLAIDGSFGPLTDSALRNYQQSKGLVVDGSCGPLTWQSLLQK